MKRIAPVFHLCTIFIIFIQIFHSNLYSSEWQKKHDFDEVRSQFEQPPKFYAPHTFWFWDAPLDPKQTAAMATEMTKQGLNPGYAHPRHSGDPSRPFPTLPKEQWLSPLWFESFDAALSEAENAGMTLGYCDEYWWPSGQAAGRVLEQHPELRAQSLKWIRKEIQGPANIEIPESYFSVAGQLSNKNLIKSSTLKIIQDKYSWQVPDGKWVVYTYNLYHHAGVDGGKVNYLDPKLMDVFIPIAHESYEKNVGEKIGTSIPGVFVDNEGDYGWKMAWSDYLADRYLELKKRDVRLWLPLLTEKDDAGLWAKARYDWFDVVSDIYSNKFLGRLSNWLKERNMYCISNLWEETLMTQTRAVGDFMRAQRAVSMPGNDCLQMKSQQVHDFKETQSVCEFEDKPFMSELMGVAGWEQTPVQMKQTLNAVTAWGVTHNVPHGINLNRKLETIPYPADWFTENPYWRYMHLWTDFGRRASFVNRQGRLVADVLLLNPLESAWALSEGYFTGDDGNTWPDQLEHINKVYSDAMDILSHSWMDYLVADKHYMQQAEILISNGQKPVLKIGKHEFSVIVMPPMFILSHSTMDKLLIFAKAGGSIIRLGEMPKGSAENGAHDRDMRKKVEELKKLSAVANPDNLPKVVKEKMTPQVKMLKGDLPLLISHRKIGESDCYWLANNSHKGQNCSLSFRDGSGRAEIWNCENGEIQHLNYKTENNRKIIDIEIKPYEAFWLVFNSREKAIASKKAKPLKRPAQIISDFWNISFPETDTVFVSSVKSIITPAEYMKNDYLLDGFDDSSWRWQDVVGPIRLEDTWRAKLLYVAKPRSHRYFRHKFTLPKKPESGLVNINADNGVSFWVNGRAVDDGPYANDLANVDIHDITSLLKKGENLVSVKVWNNMGYGTLIMQGAVQLKDGSEFDIVTNEKWKTFLEEQENWQKLTFDDSGWENVELADDKMQQREKRSLEPPQKIAFTQTSIWWRMPVPPGAIFVKLPGLSQNAKLWIDGKAHKVSSRKINLANNRMMTIKISAGEKGMETPAEFIVDKSGSAQLGSWLDMGLRRFTGFADYESEFNLEKTQNVEIDLGTVKHMAEIWINGEKVGERLWPPLVFDATNFVKIGKNTIRIRVGNLMVNEMGLKDDLDELRLWGWEGTPPDSCFDAGLLGPVTISYEN